MSMDKESLFPDREEIARNLSVSKTLLSSAAALDRYTSLLDSLSTLVTLYFRRVIEITGGRFSGTIVLGSLESGVQVARNSVVEEIQRLHNEGYAVTGIAITEEVQTVEKNSQG